MTHVGILSEVRLSNSKRLLFYYYLIILLVLFSMSNFELFFNFFILFLFQLICFRQNRDFANLSLSIPKLLDSLIIRWIFDVVNERRAFMMNQQKDRVGRIAPPTSPQYPINTERFGAIFFVISLNRFSDGDNPMYLVYEPVRFVWVQFIQHAHYLYQLITFWSHRIARQSKQSSELSILCPLLLNHKFYWIIFEW